MTNQSDFFDLPFNYRDLDLNNANNNVMNIRSTVGKIDTNGYECWLTRLTFGNSIPNFPPTDTTFTLNIPTSTGTNSVTCTIKADSVFGIQEFDALLKYVSEQNNFYLVETATNNKFYFLSALFNPSDSNVDLNFINVPTSLPSGYSNTESGMTFPASASWAQLVISDPYLLRMLGFVAGSYPPAMTPTLGENNTQQGSLFPNEQPNDVLLVLVNCVSNSISRFSNYTAEIDNSTTRVGDNIVYRSNTELYVPCQGIYSTITVSVVDTNGDPIKQLNPYWSGSLRFRKSKSVYN